MPQEDTRSEASLEQTLCATVKKLGGLCLKLPADLYLGIPDRLVLLPGGRMYFIELKRLKGVLSEPQIRFIRRLNKLGFNVRVIQGADNLRDFLRLIK